MEPFIVKSANGDKITDVEGNSYVDFVCSFGPNILGHGDERVIKSIHNAVENGLTYGATCENEIKLCEMIKDATPSAEKVRLVIVSNTSIRINRRFRKCRLIFFVRTKTGRLPMQDALLCI
ncbi:MAG: aminotransferase class III-fold pyridoxal phosphate-dependent enzyme [Ruminococcus sp.]|nr:aminotransferase class III-fold pyridoxal phosphate-dependent enzyme [Ruminococcus sp.]MDY3896150.1 aminotransferase class III-fold pyridoxal phosphate-dependent enzyme [Candidatus Fimenecus sp.]